MSYTTQAVLEQRYGAGDLKSWTDDDESGSIDAAVVAQALAAADGQIDSNAAQHYVTPLTLGDSGTAAVVRLHAGSIAGYLLASRRPANVAENMRTQYEDATKWLQMLADGRVRLAGESAVSSGQPTGGIVIAGGPAVIDRTTTDGF